MNNYLKKLDNLATSVFTSLKNSLIGKHTSDIGILEFIWRWLRKELGRFRLSSAKSHLGYSSSWPKWCWSSATVIPLLVCTIQALVYLAWLAFKGTTISLCCLKREVSQAAEQTRMMLFIFAILCFAFYRSRNISAIQRIQYISANIGGIESYDVSRGIYNRISKISFKCKDCWGINRFPPNQIKTASPHFPTVSRA